MSWARLVLLGFVMVLKAAACAGDAEVRRFPVIGYLPSWSCDPKAVQYDKLTHINYSFVYPKADGSIPEPPRPKVFREVVERAHAKGIKVALAIGGWNDGNDKPFEELAAKPVTRERFVKDAVRLVKTYDLDGIDMDWEYPDPGASGERFEVLMAMLSKALRPKGKLLSMAVVKYGKTAGGIHKKVFDQVDYVNVMAYDGRNHGALEDAEQALAYWLKRDVPKEKLILGVPFYSRPNYKPYRELLKEDPKAFGKDVVGKNTYTGIPTMVKKVELARQKAGGIMIWEITQDTTGEHSLLKAIQDAVGLQAKGK